MSFSLMLLRLFLDTDSSTDGAILLALYCTGITFSDLHVIPTMATKPESYL
jgi:hypothetical protein